MDANKNVYKIVLLGEGRVGKTSLVLRFVKGQFSDRQESTIQATYLQKDLRIGDRTVTLSVWDTAGQERFHALGPIYYRNADGALLVYDITDHDTFIRVKNWVKELRAVVGDDIKITLAANKCDLKQRQVEQQEALDYANSVGATHFLTSAKANKGVEEAFIDLTKRILESKTQKESQSLDKRKSRSTLRITDERSSSSSSVAEGRGRGAIRVVNDDEQPKEGSKCC